MSGLVSWLAPREPSYILAALFTAAIVQYAVHSRAPLWRQACFWSGLCLLYAALHSGVDSFARQILFVQTLQHIVLYGLAPVLMALSQPGDVFKGLSDVQSRLTVLTHPAIAPVLLSAVLTLWLVPSIHAATLTDDRIYRLMNCSLTVTGLVVWSAVLNGRASAFARMAMTAAVLPVQVGLGIFLFTAGTGQLGPLDDQRLSGLTMIASGIMLTGGVSAVIGLRILSAARPVVQPAPSQMR